MKYNDMNRFQKNEFDEMLDSPSGWVFGVGANFCKECGKMFKYHSDNGHCKECNNKNSLPKPTEKLNESTKPTTSAENSTP